MRKLFAFGGREENSPQSRQGRQAQREQGSAALGGCVKGRSVPAPQQPIARLGSPGRGCPAPGRTCPTRRRRRRPALDLRRARRRGPRCVPAHRHGVQKAGEQPARFRGRCSEIHLGAADGRHGLAQLRQPRRIARAVGHWLPARGQVVALFAFLDQPRQHFLLGQQFEQKVSDW